MRKNKHTKAMPVKCKLNSEQANQRQLRTIIVSKWSLPVANYRSHNCHKPIANVITIFIFFLRLHKNISQKVRMQLFTLQRGKATISY